MTTEESSELPSFPPPHGGHHHNPHLLDWLEDTMPSFLPSFLEDVEPYSLSSDLTGYVDWWAHPQDPDPDPLLAASAVASPVGPTPTVSSADPHPPVIVNPKLEASKKRKLASSRRRNPSCNDEAEANNSSDSEIHKKPSGRKAKSGGGGANSNANGNKEVRWAEQLLNPLSSAIETSNLSRVQHLLYVLQELASPAGDANHRLAANGYRSLTHRLSAPVPGTPR